MKPKAAKTPSRKLYQVKVTLLGSEPPIWRRFEVAGDVTLEKLHTILQVVMGWENAHLHEFIKDRELLEESRKLFQVAPRAGSKFTYTYDMGDSWDHEILVEKTASLPKERTYPVCLEGQRACPPEDSGAVWGYEEMLEAVKDASHPEHEHYLEWLGDDFDPEAFHPEAINQRLRRFKM